MQVMEAVQLAVHRGVNQLAHTRVNGNQMSFAEGEQYRFPARSKEEIIASRKEAAVQGTTNRQASLTQLEDPTRELGSLSAEQLVSEQEDGSIMSASGLILPAGFRANPPPQPPRREAPRVQPPVQRNDDGPVSWLL